MTPPPAPAPPLPAPPWGEGPVPAVERSRLARQIATRLEAAIREGRLLPGERLASERALSEQLGVSRPVLRQALQLLQRNALVTTRRGQGTFVRDLAAELGEIEPEAWLRAHHREVRDHYEARLIVEPECAARAAATRTEPQLVRLKQIAQLAEGAISQERALAFTGLDIDFHTCIAQMAGNRHLRDMLAAIINPDTDLRRVLHRVPGHPPIAQARHQRIVRAIERGEAECARRAMTDALQGTLHDIDRLLKGGEAPTPARARHVSS